LLTLKYEAFAKAFDKWSRNANQTSCGSAFSAGKMWMTLFFSAIMAEFEMPASLLQKNLVDKTSSDKTFEDSIDCNPVWGCVGKLCNNLVRCLRLVHTQKNRKNRPSWNGSLHLRRT
jgi:hypothetical protein